MAYNLFSLQIVLTFFVLSHQWLGAYWGISRGYLLPHFSQLFPKSTVFRYLLPVARSYLLHVAKWPSKWPMYPGNVISDQIWPEKFGLEVIVAGCNPNLANYCKLQPKTLQLLWVATKFLIVARCRIPQYVPKWSLICVVMSCCTLTSFDSHRHRHDHFYILNKWHGL